MSGYLKCSACGAESWPYAIAGGCCGWKLPNGTFCPGPIIDTREQARLARVQELTNALRALVDYTVLREACWVCGCNINTSTYRFNCEECPEVPGDGGPPPSIDDSPVRKAEELLAKLTEKP